MVLVSALGLDIKTENCAGKTRSEEFMKINPCHCVPTLELDDGTVVWESNAVLRTLCAIAGDEGDAYYPKDVSARAKIDLALDWRQCQLYTRLLSIGYIAFGIPSDDDKAKADFKVLQEEVFPVLVKTFLKDTKFVYSDTPTIADLAIAPPLVFLKARKRFWKLVPQEVKDYQVRVFEAFPSSNEHFAKITAMAEGCTAEAGAELDP
jgi:glutathione S-transferase